MWLKHLAIHHDDRLVREVAFRRGINLIVDETSSSDRRASGNSVGKTTVLRLIDFCLGGDGKNIYQDTEFKTSNAAVESFLTENNVVITLTLVEHFEDSSGAVVIKRNFLCRNKKIQSINGQPYPNPKEFQSTLKRLIFKSESEQPTFRQIISKNIRDEKHKLTNTIRVLAPNVVTEASYETLHLFWLGIDGDQSKEALVRDRNLEEKLQARLRKQSNPPQISQALLLVNNKIEDLERKKASFNLNEEFEADLNELNTVRSSISSVSMRISRLDLRRQLIHESAESVEEGRATIDLSQTAALYERSRVLIPHLQRSFDDVVKLHNAMMEKRLAFITEEVPALEKELGQLRRELQRLLKQERTLIEDVRKRGTIDELDEIITMLNASYEQKGRLEEQSNLWRASEEALKGIDDQLAKINEGLSDKDSLINARISLFNQYYAVLSERLTGNAALLSAEQRGDFLIFSVSNIEGNPGTGSKKSQMAAFDLAYIQFADTLDLPCLHFILQDQIENVHANQITNLLTEIVDEVNCQYVLPVLRDKLPVDLELSSMEILCLSQQDRLFKVT